MGSESTLFKSKKRSAHSFENSNEIQKLDEQVPSLQGPLFEGL